MPLRDEAQPAADRLLLQWHVTDRCNLRCRHCYQTDEIGPEMSRDGLQAVLGELEGLLGEMERRSGRPVRSHVTLTGGEPFLRSDFLGLLERIARSARRHSFAVLTNGHLIDQALAEKLASLRTGFVQVSVEGGEEAHDRVRGAGSHKAAVAGLRRLVAAGVPAIIAFTAHRENWREFPWVARLGRRLGVQRVWADRLVPCGRGAALAGATLGPEETRAFFSLMLRERRRWPRRGTEIAMGRALQFIVGGGRPYRCSAGDTLLTLMPDGQLLPCRRLPIPVGSLERASLQTLYFESPLLQALRERRRIPAGCERCFYSRTCAGGARCVAHAVHGDLFRADPGCWLARAPGVVPTQDDDLEAQIANMGGSGTVCPSALSGRPMDGREMPS